MWEPLQRRMGLAASAQSPLNRLPQGAYFVSNEGGASDAFVAHALFGLSERSNSSLPPLRAKDSGSHDFVVGLPSTFIPLS